MLQIEIHRPQVQSLAEKQLGETMQTNKILTDAQANAAAATATQEKSAAAIQKAIADSAPKAKPNDIMSAINRLIASIETMVNAFKEKTGELIKVLQGTVQPLAAGIEGIEIKLNPADLPKLQIVKPKPLQVDVPELPKFAPIPDIKVLMPPMPTLKVERPLPEIKIQPLPEITVPELPRLDVKMPEPIPVPEFPEIKMPEIPALDFKPIPIKEPEQLLQPSPQPIMQTGLKEENLNIINEGNRAILEQDKLFQTRMLENSTTTAKQSTITNTILSTISDKLEPTPTVSI